MGKICGFDGRVVILNDPGHYHPDSLQQRAGRVVRTEYTHPAIQLQKWRRIDTKRDSTSYSCSWNTNGIARTAEPTNIVHVHRRWWAAASDLKRKSWDASSENFISSPASSSIILRLLIRSKRKRKEEKQVCFLSIFLIRSDPHVYYEWQLGYRKK